MKKSMVILCAVLLILSVSPIYAGTLNFYDLGGGSYGGQGSGQYPSQLSSAVGTVTWELQNGTMDISIQFNEALLQSHFTYYENTLYHLGYVAFNIPSDLDYNILGFDNGNPNYTGFMSSGINAYDVDIWLVPYPRDTDYSYFNNLSTQIQISNIPSQYTEDDFFYEHYLTQAVYGLEGQFFFGLFATDQNDPDTYYFRSFATDTGGGVPAPVPEPATILLLASGLIGFAGFRKKFKKR